MNRNNTLTTATAGQKQILPDWIAPTQLSPLIFEDPGLVWLEYHGAAHGFQPDESPYEFIDFINQKSRQFEHKWLREMASQAVVVCATPMEVRQAKKVRQTFELMQRGVLVIAQGVLWWAPERIYGVPDLLVNSIWLRERFPELMDENDARASALHLGHTGEQCHYLVMDLKFTTKLDDRGKAKDLENYAIQVRLYTYMLGQLQGYTPSNAYLIARDGVDNPLPIEILSEHGEPLDEDLAAMRDLFLEIKLNGDKYRPWVDDIVSINTSHHDDRWRTAKGIIARDLVPGRDASLLYYVGQATKSQLAELGYPNLVSMLDVDPADIPFEECKRIGAKTAARMRAILQAHLSKSATMPPDDVIPPGRPYEFFIDFEYFTNVNVDFEAQWPTLEGEEMIFMIGLGWQAQGKWCYETFIAGVENSAQELAMFTNFIQRLDDLTEGAFTDEEVTALYHWTGAEVWQSKRAAERHQLPADHPLRNLPWVDLQKVFLDGPGAIPGSWDFGLKSMAKALSEYNPEYAIQWPGELDEGLRVMVMGWQAYQNPTPLETIEIKIIRQYLEADCKALWQILRWLRSSMP